MVYGQTGAGKTHTMSGGVWKHNGLIQQYVLDRINYMKEDLGRDYSLGITIN